MKKRPYRELLGAIGYCASWTRPDIATAVSICRRFQQDPGERHWRALKRCALYLRATKDRCIRFSAAAADIRMVGYVDADYAESDVDSSKSRTGYIYFVCGGPVVWRSSLQPVVAQSTCEAEYIAANAAAREAEWMRMIHDDLFLSIPNLSLKRGKPVLIHEDNQGCIALAKNFMVTKRSKHIRIRFHYLRQQLAEGIITLEYIASEENIADLLTKALKRPTFIKLRDLMVVTPL